MGGHGGLNILPQKSWNVYNYDCREKVEKDEREHAEKEAKKRNLRLDAEFENRLGSLKAKKRRRDEEAIEDQCVLSSTELAHVQPAELVEKRASATCTHINLFAVEENAEGNEEYAVEKKQEDLDEKKQFEVQLGQSSAGYGGPDIDHTPWWSKPQSTLDAPITAQRKAQLAAERASEKINQLPVSQRWGKLQQLAMEADDSEGPESPKDKKRKSKKDKKHKKHKKEKSSKSRLEDLRKERLEREKHENFREQEISSLSKPRAPIKEHKYNTGYHRNLTR